ncbi:protein phosphatase 2C domain-containing protein [Rhodococcus rhodochrous]|uniref:PP2C family protein-serine/threonine phosphatase n=1 Tax=Rhodococcus rhodochrous TaxID=1829 RepID=UPI001E48B882|nr:PP2C family serine/threonine-protein phosphatase [Rhodococcus rhodochrous]MCB8913573.1 protein phosphatase 2C domain-containing protein [Rhodococcus rhodochrous]
MLIVSALIVTGRRLGSWLWHYLAPLVIQRMVKTEAYRDWLAQQDHGRDADRTSSSVSTRYSPPDEHHERYDLRRSPASGWDMRSAPPPLVANDPAAWRKPPGSTSSTDPDQRVPLDAAASHPVRDQTVDEAVDGLGSSARMVAAGVSKAGQRSENEDTWVVTDRIAVLADGVGGNPAGKVAADLAAGTIRDMVNVDSRRPERDLKNAVAIADAVIRERADRSPEQRGMATTLDAVVLYDQGMYGTHLGDGRVYVVKQDGRVDLLTTDNVVNGHMLTSFLGGDRQAAAPRVWHHPVVPGDRLILLSDGVWGFLGDDDQLVEHLAATSNLQPEQAADLLVESALRNGGDDNTTAIVADVIVPSSDRS